MTPRRIGLVALAALALSACPGRPTRPPGPPPEYERPVVPPWDAGQPVDPLDQVEGEWVTDDEASPSGPSPSGKIDAATPDAARLPADGGVG